MAKKINISGSIGFDFDAAMLRNELAGETGDIEISLNSYGGDVYEAFEISNQIRSYIKENSAKVTIIYSGIVASAASYLSMAASERIANDNSVFMIHNAMMLVVGDHRTMNFWKDDLLKTDKVIGSAYSKVSGKSLSAVLEMMSEGDSNNGKYFYGDEIVNAGFADKLIDTNSESNKENSITESKMAFANFKSTYKNPEYNHEKIVAMIKGTEKLNIEKGESMTKEEILKGLLTLKTNNGTDLPEIAKHLNLESLLITDEQKAGIAKLNAIKTLCGEKDPVEMITELQAVVKLNADSVRAAKISEEFGPKEWDDTKKENKGRMYAEQVLGDKELTEENIKEIKENSLYISLAAERAIASSDENDLGESVGGSDKKVNGLKVEEY